MASSNSSIRNEEQGIESIPKVDPKSPLWKFVTVVGKI